MSDALLDRIRELERAARRLDPPAEERADLDERVLAHASRFLDGLANSPAYVGEPDPGAGIRELVISEAPSDPDAVLEALARHVDRPGINTASGRHLGYIPGGGIYHAALGDYLAAAINRYSGVFYASPGAVRLENVLIEWMARVVGYPESAGGNLTSGGSLANLIAIVAAREAHGIRAEDIGRHVVYHSDHVHHCVPKALRFAGLADCPARRVPIDERFRMRPDGLAELMAEDAAAGLRPWLVVATAGTADTGAVDPLGQIGEIARERGAWFHVDAAYGGFFALCEPGRDAVAGMETADSVVLDPHKALFLPYGSGAVLVRDRARLLAAGAGDEAAYLADAMDRPAEPAPSETSPELSRHFRGLRFWLPLQLLGVAPFRAAVEEKMLLARHARERLLELEGFEVGPEPDLSVVVFRAIPKSGDADALNEALLAATRADGRVFFSSTRIDGRLYLRIAVVAFRAHLADVELAIEILADEAMRLRG
ncbi:MAG: pyridoxal phosphate-dependent decarboxylase family protein [Planctomycetota bacterium]